MAPTWVLDPSLYQAAIKRIKGIDHIKEDDHTSKLRWDAVLNEYKKMGGRIAPKLSKAPEPKLDKKPLPPSQLDLFGSVVTARDYDQLLTKETLDGWTKDVKTFIKAVPKIQTMEDLLKVEDALRRWDVNLSKTLQSEGIRSMLKAIAPVVLRKGEKDPSEKAIDDWVTSYRRRHEDLYNALTYPFTNFDGWKRMELEKSGEYPLPGDPRIELKKDNPRRLEMFKDRLENYEKDVMEAWNAMLDPLKKVIRFTEKWNQDPMQLYYDKPKEEIITLDGTKVWLRNYESDIIRYRQIIPFVREALHLFKEQLGKSVPSLVRNLPKFEVEFEEKPVFTDEMGIEGFYGAWYNRVDNSVRLFVRDLDPNTSSIKNLAKSLAHEYGHFVYYVLLSQEAKDFWNKAVNVNRGKVSVEEILEAWPDSVKTSWDFVKYLRDENPELSLKVEILSNKKQLPTFFWTKEDLLALKEKMSFVNIPKNPITEYAARNSEESFTEAFGMYVIYGPKTVDPLIRSWLSEVLPEARIATSQFQNLLIAKKLLTIARVITGNVPTS